MLAKLGLYANTIKSMKASQLYYRIRKMMKMNCSVGCAVSSDAGQAEPITTVPELDFDPVFVERFPADEILTDKITILHTSKEFHWNQKWHFDTCFHSLMHIERQMTESILISRLKLSIAGLTKIRRKVEEKAGRHIRLTCDLQIG